MFTDKKDIDEWLKEMKIEEYTINEDLTVDVKRMVNLMGKKLTYLPVQFGIIGGVFTIRDNELTSLKGCPTQTWLFNASKNNITTLEYAPLKIQAGIVDVSGNKLISLRNNIQLAYKFRCDFMEEFSQFYNPDEDIECFEIPFEYVKKYYEVEDLSNRLSKPISTSSKSRKKI